MNADIDVKEWKDPASARHVRFMDRLRAWKLGLRSGVSIGNHVSIKDSVRTMLCDSAQLSIGDHSVISWGVTFALTLPRPVVTLGKWVFVGPNTTIASKTNISIGDYTLIAPSVYLIDCEHGLQAGDLIRNQRAVLKTISIGSDCLIGTGAVIRGGVAIGDGAVVGANSVVTKSLEPNGIYAGSPAKLIRYR